MFDRSVNRRVRRLIRGLLRDSGIPSAVIDDRTFLPDVLDSAALTRLVTLIEREFTVRFDDDELDLAHFENIDRLGGFVKRKLSEA